MSAFWCLVGRDLRLAYRRGGDSVNVVIFFLLTVTLFPFGVGPETAILMRIAPGVIWVVALLAAMLSLDRLFRGDFDDGSLDLMILGPLPLDGEVSFLLKTDDRAATLAALRPLRESWSKAGVGHRLDVDPVDA